MIIFKGKLVTVISQLTQLKIVFSTKEELDRIVLEQIVGMHGWVAFSEDQFKESVEKAMAERKIGINETGMSDSQVLRGTLFRIWNKSEEKISWEDYYHREMTKINKHYVTKYL